jgi:tetratricopeptide (TPR) repeat protein
MLIKGIRYILFVVITLFSIGVNAQESLLAQQYFDNGEFEKAASLFLELYQGNEENDYYLGRYVESMSTLNRFEEAEKFLSKVLKKHDDWSHVAVMQGNLLERQGKNKEAKDIYERTIKKLPSDVFQISRLANVFTNLAKYDLAIAAYEKGSQSLKNPEIFALNLGDLYRRKGEFPSMIKYYLESVNDNPNNLVSVKTLLQRFLPNEEYDELQTQLYTQIQENPESLEFPELLSWLFIQKKDYTNALKQLKAVDRQRSENGQRVFQLALTAEDEKDYDAAIACYQYLLDEKGEKGTFFFEAKQNLLSARRKKITQGYGYTKEELGLLNNDYESFFAQLGKNKNTAALLLEYSQLQALYLNDLPKAISILSEVIEFPGIDRELKNQAKLSLGDYYLMQGEEWESTLLYSQVDKEYKEDVLGQEARFRNARLSYFRGDFEWAQAQFDVLKASTSKLISNDAIDLSVFIMDNLGLDTTPRPLQLYADAELLLFQNKINPAFAKLDTLRSEYPAHSLEDDVLYLEGQIYEKMNDYDRALVKYTQVLDKYKEEIRADNALWRMAQLYEYRKKDIEKAKECYEKLYNDFSNSTFAVDARKRYRILRGDKVQ